MSKELLQAWVNATLKQPVLLTPLTGDASFRRYYRVSAPPAHHYILMDASAAKHDQLDAFVAIARSFQAAGLQVPIVHHADLEQGYLLLSDLGDVLYSERLNLKTADVLYQSALEALLKLQQCSHIEGYTLPAYDRSLLLTEMQLFDEWFWQKHLGFQLSVQEQESLNQVYEHLIAEALIQSRVCVHRDYHSRNLMVLPEHQVGILDFQDAVSGPITYDLVSLLRDCYIDWPEQKVRDWLRGYQQKLLTKGLLSEDNFDQFMRWFDWMGLQRHLKCLGIFARLNKRDQKSQYLQYLPRVLKYAQQVSRNYPELAPLEVLLSRIQL